MVWISYHEIIEFRQVKSLIVGIRGSWVWVCLKQFHARLTHSTLLLFRLPPLVLFLFFKRSLFLIMGIGADDVFVFYDTFHQGKSVLGEESRISTRFKWAYKHAGGAMLVTTATTCGSFFANALSEVAVVREFGIFMGFVVLWNYINVMTLFPAALLCHEYLIDRYCAKNQDPENDAATSTAATTTTATMAVAPTATAAAADAAWEENPIKKKGRKRLKRHSTISLKESGGKINTNKLSMVERCFYNCFTNTVWQGRYGWIIFGFTLVI